MQDSTHDGTSSYHSLRPPFPSPGAAIVEGLHDMAPSHNPESNTGPSVVAHEANLHNVAGNYIDHRTTTIKHFYGSPVNLEASHALLVGNIASGAINDSEERSRAPKCLPETRITVQNDILNWITHEGAPGDPKGMLWITGPAGTGKSAIAGTLADRCQKDGLLAASYFFSASSRSHVRRSKIPLLLTIIYQLLQHEFSRASGLKEEVLSAIKNNPVVLKKTLDQQLEELILAPLRRVAPKSDPSKWPRAIIVDAVDECGADLPDKPRTSQASRRLKEENHIEILSVLARAATDPSFPFRVIVVSRPEPAIQDFFDNCCSGTVDQVFLNEKYNPDADIALFLGVKFGEIRRQFNLSSSWPSQEVIDFLVREASGHFIYVETIIRFFEHDITHPPHERLHRILERPHVNTTSPLTSLYTLYSRIVNTSPNPTLAIDWLLTLQESDPEDAWYTKAVLESHPGEAEFLLKNLASLVGMSNDNGVHTFHFYHKSFLDFLKDKTHVHRVYPDHRKQIEAIKRERYYRVLKHRGPQGILSSPIRQHFVAKFCRRHVWHIETRRPEFKYTTSDVEWWMDNLEAKERSKAIPQVFDLVHDACSMLSCTDTCRVWRSTILKRCKEESWRIPTTWENLLSTIVPWHYDSRSAGAYPLRPTISQDLPIDPKGHGIVQQPRLVLSCPSQIRMEPGGHPLGLQFSIHQAVVGSPRRLWDPDSDYVD